MRSGCRSVADAAPLQLLLWLHNAQQRPGEWPQLLRASLAHEAWFRWQQALWGGASAALPAAHRAACAPRVVQQWEAFAQGPMRLHAAAATVLATGVTGAAAAPLAERAAKLVQLKLAARHLRQLSTGKVACNQAQLAASEWRAAAAVAAVTLAAHQTSVGDARLREQLAQAMDSLASGSASTQEQGAGLLRTVHAALAASTHPVLQSLAEPVVLPMLHALVQGPAEADATANLWARGRCWALLGLLRVQLLVPPAGVDPAAKYGLLSDHTLGLLRIQLEPELAIRRQAQQLPGGPSEEGRIEALEQRAAGLAQRAEQLQQRSTPRPTPPSYLAVRPACLLGLAAHAHTKRTAASKRCRSRQPPREALTPHAAARLPRSCVRTWLALRWALARCRAWWSW